MKTSSSPHQAKSHFSVKVKAIAQDGSFQGDLAVYNNVDLGGDLIEPGAFTKTIQENGPEVPLLWQHKSDTPIGTLTLADGPNALHVTGQLLMDLPEAQKAYQLIKARVIKGLSIGYDTIKDQVDSGVRRLKEVRLWEGSIVTFPMNPAASISFVKAAGMPSLIKGDFSEELAEVQLQDAGYQMRCALFQALGATIWASGISRDEKISTLQTICEQFTAAFLEYAPQYLDWLAAEYGDMETMGRLRMEEKSFGNMLTRGAASIKQVRPLLTAGETKEGRKHSAATLTILNEAREHVKCLSDNFDALFDDEADDDPEADGDDLSKGAANAVTPKEKAAAEKKSEPVPDHSAAERTVDEMTELLRKAKK